MPQTKFQSFVFTILMVFCMVFSMTCYTLTISMGGLTAGTFGIAIREMWIEYVIVFCLIFFFITKNAQKLALRIIIPGQDRPIFMILAIQCFTVCQIVPVITLIATFLHQGVTANWYTQWITTAVHCFPMALCLQIFFVGPLVRHLFGLLFSSDKTSFRCEQ